MKVSIHSLYWDNGKRLQESNKKVSDHFGFNVQYHNMNGAPHGLWMNAVLDQIDSDIFDTLILRFLNLLCSDY